MSDIEQLEQSILTDIAAAADEAALEAVRVAALGKSGSVSALLKTLGAMTPDERKAKGPAINGLKDASTPRSPRASDALKNAALDAAPQHRERRCHAAGARKPGRNRPHPSDQPGDRRTHRDLRRYGLRGRRRSGHRDRRLQLHQAELSRRPSGAGNARHVLFQSEAGRLAAAAAHAHLAGAGAHHADAEAADPRDHSRAAPIAATPTRPTRRCSIRSRAWSSTRARISAT